MTDDAPRWLEIARTYNGRERGPWLARLFAEAGHPEVTDPNTPWCAASIGAWLHEAGQTGSGSLAASSYLTFRQGLDAPRIGCIAVLDHHVGFVDWIDGDRVGIISGNSGRSHGKSEVNISTYKASSVLAWRWPIPIVTPADLDAAGSRTTAKGKTDVAIGAAKVVAGIAAVTQSGATGPKETLQAAGSIADMTATLGMWSSFGKAVDGVWAMLHHDLLAVVLIIAGVYLIASGNLLRGWRTSDANSGKAAPKTGAAP